MLDAYWDFLTALTTEEFARIFWFFVVFELPRYIVLDYIVLVVYFIYERINKKSYTQARSALRLENPLVSVIVPGKNEGATFYQLARSLKEQTYQHYELIVVDDGSDDDSPLIGRDLEKRGIIDLFLRNEDRGGKASAANLALRYARGKFVVHLDADCSLNRDALERVLVPFYLDEKIGAVGGTVGVRNARTNLCTLLQSIEYHFTISVGRLVTSMLGILRIVSGAFGAFRRETLLQVGGWDIGPGLDGDITIKIRKAGYRVHMQGAGPRRNGEDDVQVREAGYRIHFDPQAVALTDVPTSFSRLARQRLRWQRSLVRFRLRKHLNIFAANQNFSFRNLFSFVENLFYNLILNIAWFIYLYDIIVNFTPYIAFILITNFLIYAATKYVQFIAVLIVTKNRESQLYLLPFVPLMVLYTGYYLRVVRTIAYFSEFFFKSSYKDPFNPAKTSEVALQYRL